VKKLEFAALIEIGFLGLVVSVRRTWISFCSSTMSGITDPAGQKCQGMPNGQRSLPNYVFLQPVTPPPGINTQTITRDKERQHCYKTYLIFYMWQNCSLGIEKNSQQKRQLCKAIVTVELGSELTEQRYSVKNPQHCPRRKV
jgi:hypothetical protein